jgi:hypothetical protein
VRRLISLLVVAGVLALSGAAAAASRGGHSPSHHSSSVVPTGLYGGFGGLSFSVIGQKIQYLNWNYGGGNPEDIICTAIDYSPAYEGPIHYWVGIGEAGAEAGIAYGVRLAHPVTVRLGRRFSLHEHFAASALYFDPPFNSERAQIEAPGPTDGGQLEVEATPRLVHGLYEIAGNIHYSLTSPSYLGTCACRKFHFVVSKNSLKRVKARPGR